DPVWSLHAYRTGRPHRAFGSALAPLAGLPPRFAGLAPGAALAAQLAEHFWRDLVRRGDEVVRRRERAPAHREHERERRGDVREAEARAAKAHRTTIRTHDGLRVDR